MNVLGLVFLFTIEGRKSVNAVVLGTGEYKCVINLGPPVTARFCIALNFCFCINWEASGVGISLRLNIECLFSYKKKMTTTLNLSVLVLATMVAVLAGMVGYMYWQQNKVIQAVSQLSGFVASQFIKQPDLEVEEESEEDDDRESVEETATAKEEVESSPKEDKPTEIVTDIDDLQGKTAVQLKELLSKKGIPYGKRDSKSVLLQLLKASS